MNNKMKVSLGRNQYVEVSSFMEASEIVTADIDKKGQGSREWYDCSAGRIFLNDKQIAYVSYNGRVWEGTSGSKEIPIWE